MSKRYQTVRSWQGRVPDLWLVAIGAALVLGSILALVFLALKGTVAL